MDPPFHKLGLQHRRVAQDKLILKKMEEAQAGLVQLRPRATYELLSINRETSRGIAASLERALRTLEDERRSFRAAVAAAMTRHGIPS